MAKKKTDAEPGPESESLLVTAAKSLGTAAGKIAHLAGATAEAEPTPPKHPKVPKLASKNKTRMPRKAKKAMKAAQAKQG